MTTIVRTKKQKDNPHWKDEVQFLQFLIEYTTDYCDFASLISLRSKPDMNFLMGRVRENLDTIVPVLKTDYLDEQPATIAVSYPMLRFQLEFNLAFAYSVLIHTQKAVGLATERDTLFQQAKQRMDALGFVAFGAQYLFYRGMVAYHDGVAAALDDKKENEIKQPLEDAISQFQNAHKASQLCVLYDERSLFNLGRTYFTLGQKDKAQRYFRNVLSMPAGAPGGILFIETMHHLESLDKAVLGTVLGDPSGFREGHIQPIMDIENLQFMEFLSQLAGGARKFLDSFFTGAPLPLFELWQSTPKSTTIEGMAAVTGRVFGDRSISPNIDYAARMVREFVQRHPEIYPYHPPRCP